ncbi:hypothetical protein MXB_2666 [Myxobolus squamalis]|nr:hypothetical protein MXB_2666 [Myxobolus squamalis]
MPKTQDSNQCRPHSQSF